MQRFLFPVIGVLALLLCSGCGDTHEKIAKQSVSVMKEMVATLEKVTDAASARAHKAQLASLIEQMNDLNKRMEALGLPSEDQVSAMEGGVGKEMEGLMEKMTQNMMRIAFDAEIQKELEDLPSLN